MQSQAIAVSTLFNNQQTPEKPLNGRSPLNCYNWERARGRRIGVRDGADRVSIRPPPSSRPV
jgi:hypothetical protein